jgi:hypothetical protein
VEISAHKDPTRETLTLLGVRSYEKTLTMIYGARMYTMTLFNEPTMGLHQPTWSVAPDLLDESLSNLERVKEADRAKLSEQDMKFYLHSKRTSKMPNT